MQGAGIMSLVHLGKTITVSETFQGFNKYLLNVYSIQGLKMSKNCTPYFSPIICISIFEDIIFLIGTEKKSQL